MHYFMRWNGAVRWTWRKVRVRPAVAALAAMALALPARAAVQLPPILGSHMVLQRDLAAPIWGTAEPGEKITVTFRGQNKMATTGADGHWMVKLDPMKAGGPEILTVAGSNTLTLTNVLVGEVWVGSGQSNMEIPSRGFVAGDPVLSNAVAVAHPNLRLFMGARGWQEATPGTGGGFSALLFCFGATLQPQLDVPVGLMVGAVGGTPSGFWLTPAMFAADKPCQELVQTAAARFNPEQARAQYETRLAEWEKAVEKAKAEQKRPPGKPAMPLRPGECRGQMGNLYEAHIFPFIPYGIRGVLWDQGESGTAVESVDQYTLMGALIRGWRAAWGQGDFPFLCVQKPSGGGSAADPSDPVTGRAEKFTPQPILIPGGNDGKSRENHIRIMTYPNTALVISTDLGSGVHPANKSGYGARAARVALGMVYGRNVEYYGPLYHSYAVEGRQVRLRFTHVGKGLMIADGPQPQGFIIAGKDKVFHWATAVLDGDTVLVSSDQVAEPVAVRYAWGNVTPWANLFNKDGLPALTFRTDSW